MPEIIEKQDHRRAFIDTLIELAEKDDKIVLIIPDVGFNYIEKFQEKFPDRFFNFGVTEQSCILIAAGMALSGMKPYVYSMVNFVLFRPFEMVRNGIVNHHANVKLLGVQGSSSYKFLGFSHNFRKQISIGGNFYDEDELVCETIGLPCSIPQSNEEVRQVILDSYKEETARYIRL